MTGAAADHGVLGDPHGVLHGLNEVVVLDRGDFIGVGGFGDGNRDGGGRGAETCGVGQERSPALGDIDLPGDGDGDGLGVGVGVGMGEEHPVGDVLRA